MFLCQLTGSVPQHAVVTREGHLYEKAALLNYLQKHDFRDPISSTVLNSEEDLVDLKSTSLVNKPSSAIALGDLTSILEILNEKIQNIMIELQEVKRERDEARHQLTHLLYLRDSAAQLIAKHIEEIDFLKNQLKEARARRTVPDDQEGSAEKMQRRTAASEISERIKKHSDESLVARKQRKINSRYPEELKKFKTQIVNLNTNSAGSTKKPTVFKNTIISESQDGNRSPGIVSVGYTDSTVSIYLMPRNPKIYDQVDDQVGGQAAADQAADPVSSQNSAQRLTTLSCHEGSITALETLLYPSLSDLSETALASLNSSSSSPSPYESCLNVFTGSEKGLVRHWKEPNYSTMEEILWLEESKNSRGKFLNISSPPSSFMFATQAVHSANLGPISSLKIHPIGTLLGVTGTTSSWALLDLITGQIVNYKLTGVDPAIKCKSIEFQPDGTLGLCAVTSSSLPIWDIRSGEVEAALTLSAPVRSLSFSEIGYQVALATEDDQVSIYDLRKISPPISTIPIPNIVDCHFDYSGKHVAVLSSDAIALVHATGKKQFEVVATWTQNTMRDGLQIAFDSRTDDFISALTSDNKVFIASF